jgi:tetratricopeptide (TPR) repeat protein/TolB-like protein
MLRAEFVESAMAIPETGRPATGTPQSLGDLPERYRVVCELGRGGMGIVYKAVDLVDNREVAVKTLMSQLGRDPVAHMRFNREGRTASSLSHPNICQIFAIGEHKQRPFIVMELLEGETLRKRLGRGQCDTPFVLNVAIQVARGLQAAHSKFIIHRDIKPANIMVTPSGVVKILDFGLAKHFAGVDTPTVTSMTEPGQMIGTVDYMSPEQLLGHRLDQRSDFFSLGVLLYEVLTGHKPFSDKSAIEAMASILTDAPRPLTAVPFVAEWSRIFGRLLAKDVNGRYTGADALLAELEVFDRLTRGLAVAWPQTVTSGVAPVVPLMAVLPLDVETSATDTDEQRQELEYFCHGLDDELMAGLMRVTGLRVVPPTLVGKSRRGQPTPSRVGRRLHADYVLSGTVQLRDELVAIVVSLHDVHGDSTIWSKRYERLPERLLSLRDAMVRDVAAELQLSADRPTHARRRDVGSRHAFNLCLKGRFYWSKRYEGGLQTARQCFEEAIALDPMLAAAHAGLADTHSFLGFYCLRRPRTAFDLARASAEQALRLDPGLADAHTSLGLVRLGGDWDWEGARLAFERASELDPTYGPNRIYHSWVLVLLGRTQEALEEAERAQDLDPLSPVLNAGAAYTLFLSRGYERSIRECERALEIDRDFLLALYVMAMSKAQLGLLDEAIAEMERVVDISKGMPFYLALLGKFYGDANRTEKVTELLSRVDGLSGTQYVPPHCYVYIYAGLRDFDRAFEWQDKAFEDGASPFNYLSPVLECLHADPRFQRDLRDWGLQF